MEGDIAFLLGCEHLVPEEVLRCNKHNIVVHPSKLPHGKGFSPLAWQIIKGKNSIPIVLFEAVKEVDAGAIYYFDELRFEGHELNDEIKHAQGEKTVELVLRFVNEYPNVTAKKQSGESTFYPRRTCADSKLDVNKSLSEQFNLLRVVDNKRYPAFFWYKNHKYVLKIHKVQEDSGN
jgi:methionyl-tRNA formyltransferase